MYKFAISFLSSLTLVGSAFAQQNQEWSLSPVEILNTSGDEYAPRMESLGLLYSRSPSTGDPAIDMRTEMMYSAFRQNGLQEGRLFSEELSSQLHESSACLGPNNNFVVFSRNSPKKASTNYLYLSRIGVHDFQEAEQLPFNDSRYNSAHPTIDRSGKRLLFSSDRPGGYGGFDLYYAEYKNGEWSKAINLGEAVNSTKDDIFPNWGENELITFSSNRPGGLGGIDLYLLDASNADWKRVKHLGKPFSSEGDDHGLSWSLVHGKGFLASNREGGKGGDDIYTFTFSEESPIFWLVPGTAEEKLVVLNEERVVVAHLDDRNLWHDGLAAYPDALEQNFGKLAQQLCGSFNKGIAGTPDSIRMMGIRVEIKRADVFQPLDSVRLRNPVDNAVYLTDATGGVCIPSPSHAQSWIIEKQGFRPVSIAVDPARPFVVASLDLNYPADSIFFRNVIVCNRRISESLSDKLIRSLSEIGIESGYRVIDVKLNLLSTQSPKRARAEADRLAKVIAKELQASSYIPVSGTGLSVFSDEGNRAQSRIGVTAEAVVNYEILLKKIPSSKEIGLTVD